MIDVINVPMRYKNIRHPAEIVLWQGNRIFIRETTYGQPEKRVKGDRSVVFMHDKSCGAVPCNFHVDCVFFLFL